MQQQASNLLTTLTTALPDFARRHTHDVAAFPAVADYLWPKSEKNDPFQTGLCTCFAAALRRWSCGRLSILLVSTVSTAKGHVYHALGLLAQGSGEVVVLDSKGEMTLKQYISAEQREVGALQMVPTSAWLRLCHHSEEEEDKREFHSFVAHLADAMDREIGDGAQLFAGLPPQPVDATKLF